MYQGMHRAIEVITPSVLEPVTLDLATDHFRVSNTDENSLIENVYLPAAINYIEEQCHIAVTTQTIRLTLDCFPNDSYCPVFLPRPPLQSITSIQYVDTGGSTQTWSSSLYRVDTRSRPGRVYPAYGQVWPSTQPVSGAVTITYVAGYTLANIPAGLKTTILKLALHDFENREMILMGANSEEIEMAKQREIRQWKTLEVLY